MPVVKPITSKAIYEAATSMNKSLEKHENKRQQKLQEQDAKARLESNALYEACVKFNDIMNTPYIQIDDSMYKLCLNLDCWCTAFIFSVAEL